MFWYGHGMGGWGYGLMTLSFIVFWGLVIAAIVLLVRHFGRPGQQAGSFQPPGSPAATRSTAEQLLSERYARGEIDDEEYQRRLNTLREASGIADETRT
jgi:putative membrane protein